jgi:hypothetical protein
MYFATDSEGRKHAAIYVIWDHNCAYYLMGGANPLLRNSGATSLLIHTAISEMRAKVRYWDFEGSMIQSIERYFSAYGAIQVPYFQISKTSNFLLRLRDFIRQ